MPQLTLPFLSLPVPPSQWKQQALAWANEQHEVVAYYDANNLPYKYDAFQNMLGVRKYAEGTVSSGVATSWSDLEEANKLQPDFPLLGFLSYDLKNGLENLVSQHPDYIGFPELYFFVPEVLFTWSEKEVTIQTQTTDPTEIAEAVGTTVFLPYFSETNPKIKARYTKGEYLQTVGRLREHILEGDVYEVNLCQEFFAENYQLNPLAAFWNLMEASPTPFSAFLKLKQNYVMCASPERFLKKEKDLLISQPIKGTIKRGQTPKEDEANRLALATSEKERAENMMIVDLVRNDLNRVAETGSVQVAEMFGLYEFQYVWQMVSTITGRLPAATNSIKALQATFPMGSMTGAPKIKAMELIEKYEKTKRGLYSGSLGYFLPNGDFDFNVVIRSLQYNANTGYLSYEVGSAITYDSDPEQEYEECLLKAAAIVYILEKFNFICR